MINKNIAKRLLFLTSTLKTLNYSSEDIKKVKKAFSFAEHKHLNQTRKSGEPYIIHPLETAIFLAQWKMDTDTIISGLLHDVLEDTNCTKEEIESKFGTSILVIVDSVTKVSKLSGESRAKETYEADNAQYLTKVLMMASKDIRAIMVKIADRMHNMLTINHLKKEKQLKIAIETFNVYANMAGRIGLYDQKTQLLDLSFSIIDNENYVKTKNSINKLLEQNKKHINFIYQSLVDIFKKNEINVEIQQRLKGVYSTYKKIQKGLNIYEINDIFACRIIGNFNELKCYEILGLIHLNFTCLSKKFKDYISTPKLNLYQSLHTTITYQNALVEAQIRNQKMDNIANYGIAAHWMYKEDNKDVFKVVKDLMYDIFNHNENDFFRKIKSLEKNRIYDVLLMNNNKWYVVSEGSTVLDLAYRYNPSKVVNLKNVYKEGLIVPFSYNPIKDDIITFEFSDSFKATKEWENYVTNPEAKLLFSNLKCQHFDDEINEIKKYSTEQIVSVNEIKKRVNLLEFTSLNSFIDFYYLEKKINKKILYKLFIKSKKWKKTLNELQKIKDFETVVQYNLKDIQGINYKKVFFTDCCSKLPEMQLVGILNKNNIHIHRFDCEKVNQISKRFVIEWDEQRIQKNEKYYNVTIIISFEENEVKINPIIHLITSKGIEIVYMNYWDKNLEKIAIFTLKILNLTTLNKLIRDLKFKFEKIKSIKIK